MSDQAINEDRLKTRLIVSILGIPALLWIIWQGGIVYALFITLVVMIGLWEYLRLLRMGGLTPRPLLFYLGALSLLTICFHHAGLIDLPLPEDILDKQFLILIVSLILILQAVEVIRPSTKAWTNLALHVLGVLWIAGFGGCFILVRSAELPSTGDSYDTAFRLTATLYISVWICDSLAYFIGKRFGKRKILPHISPKKTAAGTVSGLFGAFFTVFLLGFIGFLPMEVFSLFSLLILGLFVGVAGQIGDFAESHLKRDFNVKDAGSLLPGHGGVLDRFDSLLFVMPLTYLYLFLTF